MRVYHVPFAIDRQPVPAIRLSHTSDLFHWSSWVRLPSLVASIRQASSASVENTPCDAVLFCRLCPSPSQVHYFRSACPAHDLLHHHHCLCHPPNYRNLQDCSDSLRWHSTSPQMLFQALWLSILPFRHFSYLPAAASLLSLRLPITFLPERSLYPHNPRSIPPSLGCLRCVFLGVSLPQVWFWIASYAMLQGLGPFQLTSHSRLHLLHAIVGWSALPIYHICRPVVVKGSFSEHWPLYFVLTLLIGMMLDVARYGPHEGKLRLLCRVW